MEYSEILDGLNIEELESLAGAALLFTLGSLNF